MNSSQYLKALRDRVETEKVHSVTKAKKHSQSTVTENPPFVYYVLNFGSLMLCFHEVDEILLKKQIWRDLAEFAVKNKQTETIERREVFVSYSKEQSISSIKRPGVIETIFLNLKESYFWFGVA